MTQAKPRSRKATSRSGDERTRPTSDAATTPAAVPVQPEQAFAATGTPSPVQDGAPKATRPTKAAQLQAMLATPGGTTLARLCETTGWQSHTVCAALTRLRQAGHAVERSKSEAGETDYCIAPGPEAQDSPAADQAFGASQSGPDSLAGSAEPANAAAAPDGNAS
jgi:hypothetical protein